MATMRSPTPPDLTSRTNPRVAAVAALRDRRERERQGLTIVDGAREVRRAIESGAEVVEAYVCEPLLAGPDARGALDALANAGVTPTTISERRVREARVRRPRGGTPRGHPGPGPVARPPGPAGGSPGRRDRRGREARQHRRGAALGRRGRRGRPGGGVAADRPLQPERGPGERRHDLPRAARRRAVRRRPRLGPRGRPPDRDHPGRRRPPVHRRRPARPARDRARRRGRRADRRPGPPPTSRPSRSPCAASPTASTCRSPRPCCSSRRAGNATVIRDRQTDPMDTFDFVIIGAGPGGEAAANKARELGASVAVVDARWFGGSCPHIGCVPSKALLNSAARHAANPAAYDWARASARRDYMINRAADAAEPDDSGPCPRPRGGRRGDVPRGRADRGSGPGRRHPRWRHPCPRGRATSSSPSDRTPRRRRSRASTRSRSGRIATRPSPEPCRRAC